MRETELQGLIMDWLAANHVFAIRMNTGAMKTDDRFVRFGIPGMADILSFCHPWHEGPAGIDRHDYVIPTWIECKVGRNGQSDLQKSFQKQVEREGHRYILAYSIETVEAHFK